MPVPITSYRPAREFVWCGAAGLVITAVAAWVGVHWPFAWIAFGLALLTSVALFALALGPSVELFDSHLKHGARIYPWAQIRRLDQVSLVPLVVKITLANNRIIWLAYAGRADAASKLLKQLRRYSREALIDGVPHRQFWGEAISVARETKRIAAPRYPLLLPEDEAEIERMFQRLKAVGNIDQKSGPDEG